MNIVTNPRYWDCECDVNFIHSKVLKKCPNECKYDENISPDSRQNEIEQFKVKRSK